MSADAAAEWRHLGNLWTSAEWFECTGCGAERCLSNRSEQWAEHREPEPCECHDEERGEHR